MKKKKERPHVPKCSFQFLFSMITSVILTLAGCSLSTATNPWAADSATPMDTDGGMVDDDGGQTADDSGQLAVDGDVDAADTDSGSTFEWRGCNGAYYARIRVQVDDNVANTQFGECASGWDPVLLTVTRPDGTVGNIFADGEDVDQLIPGDGSWGGEVRLGAHCDSSSRWFSGWAADRTVGSYGFIVTLWTAAGDQADVSALMTMPGDDGYRPQIPIQAGTGCE